MAGLCQLPPTSTLATKAKMPLLFFPVIVGFHMPINNKLRIFALKAHFVSLLFLLPLHTPYAAMLLLHLFLSRRSR